MKESLKDLDSLVRSRRGLVIAVGSRRDLATAARKKRGPETVVCRKNPCRVRIFGEVN